MTPGARFAAALALLPPGPRSLGLAVSGGGDSIALLHLAARWAQGSGCALHVVTVDHGLRDASADEARFVASACAALDLPHDTLRWTGWDGAGNLQDSARRARKRLITEWAAGRGVDAVLTGHTADDQAETVLMRLARGSGVDGLAGMAALSPGDPPWLRPLLALGRADLRDWLRGTGIAWIEDPSNDDARFDRVRARKMAAALADLGLTRDRLLQTAEHMQAARRSLRQAARGFAARHVVEDRGDLVLDDAVLRIDRGDTERRVLAAALAWIGGAAYRPRFATLRDAASAVMDGRRATLAGCLLTPIPGGCRICREPSAVAGHSVAATAAGALWDGRWLIAPAGGAAPPPGSTIRALGEAGIALCPDWRDTGLPRASVLGAPAVWQGEELVAAPLAGQANGWVARIVADFPGFMDSH